MSKRKITIIIDDCFVGDPTEPLLLAMFSKAQSSVDPQVSAGYKSLVYGLLNARVEVIEDDR